MHAFGAVIAVVALAALGLVFYVVRRSKPGRFRLSVKLLKLLDISIEVDGQDQPDEQPLSQRSAAAPVDEDG